MIHLMNSAMMPAPGVYRCWQIAQKEFAKLVQEAHRAGTLQSSIGYPQNVQIIRQLTGITVPLSRDATELNDGDEMLIMRLIYRATAPKGIEVDAADFEYFKAVYNEV